MDYNFLVIFRENIGKKLDGRQILARKNCTGDKKFLGYRVFQSPKKRINFAIYFEPDRKLLAEEFELTRMIESRNTICRLFFLQILQNQLQANM